MWCSIPTFSNLIFFISALALSPASGEEVLPHVVVPVVCIAPVRPWHRRGGVLNYRAAVAVSSNPIAAGFPLSSLRPISQGPAVFPLAALPTRCCLAHVVVSPSLRSISVPYLAVTRLSLTTTAAKFQVDVARL